MPELRLTGCRSQPLIGYLKALGTLRIVSAQVDSDCRGRWRHGAFELRLEQIDETGLVDFMLDEYVPAPVVSPWNGGSGFYEGGNPAPVRALKAIEESDEARLRPYRETIAAARQALQSLGVTSKPEQDRALKAKLVRELRRALPDDGLAWLDTAIVAIGDRVQFPPLLGSGGNDGNWDISKNYMEALGQLLDGNGGDGPRESIEAALYGRSMALTPKLSLGHLSRDGSPTNSPKGDSDSLGNPFDLILAVEGALLLAAGAARRHGAETGGALVAPFTARPTAAGYGSAASDEDASAELWLPLWSRWASRGEIEGLARESRAKITSGRSHRQAVTGLDFARAAGELGVARGLDAFERYALVKRAGQDSLAVPVGRISVAERPAAVALAAVDPWLTSMQRFADGDNCPRAARAAIRELAEAMFAAASVGQPPDLARALEAMGAAEHTLARSAPDRGPQPLRPVPAAPWVKAADDNSHEFAVAVSIASLHDPWAKQGEDHPAPALRDYLHGTHLNDRRQREFEPGRRQAVAAGDAVSLLAAIHARRHIDARRLGAHEAGNPAAAPKHDRQDQRLGFAAGTWCEANAARMFATGELDPERILRLVRGLALLDHTKPQAGRPTSETTVAAPAYELLALAWGVRSSTADGVDATQLGPRPGWAAGLARGATSRVIEDAHRRLRIAGLPPIAEPRDLLATASSGSQLAAALLIPLEPRHLKQIVRERTTYERRNNDLDDPKETG